MSFAGHALDIYNRELRKANRNKLKESKEAHITLSKNHASLKIKKKEK